MQSISQTSLTLLDDYSVLPVTEKFEVVYDFALKLFAQRHESSLDKELKWLKNETIYLKRWFAHQDKMATIRSIVKTLENHEFGGCNSESDYELDSYSDEDNSDIETCEDDVEDKDGSVHSPIHSCSSVSLETFNQMSHSVSDYPTRSSSSSSSPTPMDRLTSLLASHQSDPCQTFVIVAKCLDHESDLETKRITLKYLQSAIDENPIEAWSNTQGIHPKKARITSALHVARAYTNGELRADNQQSTDEKIERYYKIALEKYGPEDGDYLGISYYNRACLLEQRIVKARNQGVPPSELRKLYQEFCVRYDGCLRGNQPMQRTSEILYSVADMYYQIIQLSDELRMKKDGILKAVSIAFKLCLEALSIDTSSNERMLLKTLQSKTVSNTRFSEEHRIKMFILLGHLLTQDYFIPGAHSAGYFTDLDRERECGFWAYVIVLVNLHESRSDYKDALCWAVESCALLDNKKSGRSLASTLFGRITEISSELSIDQKEDLCEDLIKLGADSALLAKLRLR